LSKFINNEVDPESREIVNLIASLAQNRPQDGVAYTQQDIQNVRNAAEEVLKEIQGKVEKRLETV